MQTNAQAQGSQYSTIQGRLRISCPGIGCVQRTTSEVSEGILYGVLGGQFIPHHLYCLRSWAYKGDVIGFAQFGKFGIFT